MPQRFRRLEDSLRTGSLLTPILEKALLTRASQAWPEEYPIRVYNKERHWDGFFHPSSHCDTPEMLLYYMFNPKVDLPIEKHSIDTIMNFQVGSVLHAMVQSLLIETELTTVDEVEVEFKNTEHNVTGTVDVRKIFLPSGEILPLEFKTASYIPKELRLEDRFYGSYLRQFQVYMDIGCEEPQEKGIMLFMGKPSPHKFKEFIIYRDETILNDIYSKWSRVLEAIAFEDPTMLEFPCHEPNSKSHLECPAQNICKLGPAKTGKLI